VIRSGPIRQASLGRRGLIAPSDKLSTDARRTGQVASERRAGSLEALMAGSGVRLLNDRRVPGARATIDHLAVGPRGVSVINAVRESGRARVAGGRLLVDGVDRTALVQDVLRGVAVIRLGLAAFPMLPVRGAICWVEPALPRVSKLSLDGVAIDGPRALAEALRGPGPVSPRWVEHFAAILDRRLPPRA
jgi:hypothetical protein